MRNCCILFFMLLALNLFAGSGTINFVETTVELNKAGEANVAYVVQYKVLSGEMHGFYFSGNDRLVINSFSDESYAVDDFGNRYKLDIKKVSSDKWDIILADGQGVSSGTITYVFYFNTNFNSAGYLVNTEKDDGQMLTVFNWSPVKWDEAHNMQHYTLKVILPEQAVEGYPVMRDYYMGQNIIMTEKFVNEKFRIDYQKSKTGKLMLVFHKEFPGVRYDMRTQFYMPASWFSLAQTELYDSNNPDDFVPVSEKKADKSIFIVFVIIVLVIF
jgi:hypothetical protein